MKGEQRREVKGDVWVVGGSVRDLVVDEGVAKLVPGVLSIDEVK